MIQKLRNYDFLLIITPILLAGFGIVMIYSASMVSTVISGLESTYYMKKQLQWFILGLIVFIGCLFIPYRFYQKIVIPLVGLSFLALILVLFFGVTENNATRAL